MRTRLHMEVKNLDIDPQWNQSSATSRVADPDPAFLNLDPDLHWSESWIRICNKSQNSEDLQIKIEPWRVYRPDVADFHHLDEEQDPDGIWLRITVKSCIQNRIKVKS